MFFHGTLITRRCNSQRYCIALLCSFCLQSVKPFKLYNECMSADIILSQSSRSLKELTLKTETVDKLLGWLYSFFLTVLHFFLIKLPGMEPEMVVFFCFTFCDFHKLLTILHVSIKSRLRLRRHLKKLRIDSD